VGRSGADLPGRRAAAVAHCPRQHRTGAEAAWRPARRTPRPRAAVAGRGRARPLRRIPAARSVRRHAPACPAGPRPGGRPARPADGRAVRRAGHPDQGHHATTARRHLAGPPHHGRVRHPRPRRSPPPGRPDRRPRTRRVLHGRTARRRRDPRSAHTGRPARASGRDPGVPVSNTELSTEVPVLAVPDISDAVRIDTDVIVVGGGTAGTMAALTAAEQGANVLLLEKAHVRHSGALAMGMDGVNNAVIPGKAEPEDYVAEITRANDGIVDQRTVYQTATRGFAMVQRLERYGVKFEKDEYGEYAVRRVHRSG